MATKIIETFQYFDDLTKEEVREGELSTIEFSYAGRDFTIDLSATNARKLDDFLSAYIEAATPVKKATTFKASGTRQKVDVKAIRAWGKTLTAEDQARLFPSDKGALRKAAIEAYNDVHGSRA